ncbi:MAG: hypothetical protein NT062_38335, partial [Proteobacteria bacterium]|nr:hypothetical protein [Pseudomonadota bacterium]
MAGLTAKLAKRLDDLILDDFADIYCVEDVLEDIAAKHDLDAPEVVAALGTCADVRSVAQRLVARPPAALVAGLTATAKLELRPSAALLVRALLDGARLEAKAPPLAPTTLPALARVERLPRLALAATGKPAPPEATIALLAQLRQATLATRAEAFDEVRGRYAEASLRVLGRALALGWLAFGAEPKD